MNDDSLDMIVKEGVLGTIAPVVLRPAGNISAEVLADASEAAKPQQHRICYLLSYDTTCKIFATGNGLIGLTRCLLRYE